MDLIDSQTSRVVAKALDGVSKRHTAIASNIANAETPGYKRLDVDFEDTLKQAIDMENKQGEQSKFLPEGALKTTSGKHFNPNPVFASTNGVQAHVERSQFLYRYDKNGVDIEKSMAELAKNSGKYSALSRMESKYFSSMRGIIRGGGG